MRPHARDGSALFFGVLFIGIGLTYLVRELLRHGVGEHVGIDGQLDLGATVALSATIAGVIGLIAILAQARADEPEP